MTTTMIQVLVCLALVAFTIVQEVQGAEGGLRHLVAENSTNIDMNTTVVEPSDEDAVDGPVEDIEESATEAPTEPAIPNEICTNAVPLPISEWTSPYATGPEIVARGTTIGTTRQQVLIGCGGSLVYYGVWYTVVGAGEIFAVSTCSEGTDFETVVSVYSGTCSELVCVARNNNDPDPNGCVINPKASRTSWQSQVGVTYYVLLRSRLQTVGNFELSLEGYRYNDVCPNARPAYLGLTVVGDTTTGKDVTDILENCGYTSDDWTGEFSHLYPDSSPRGLWYKVFGTGNRMRATTCNPQGDTAYQAHRIHVFQSSCGDTCIGGLAAGITCATYEWETSAGTIYYLVVHKTYSVVNQNPPPAAFNLTVAEVGSVTISRSEPFD